MTEEISTLRKSVEHRETGSEPGTEEMSAQEQAPGRDWLKIGWAIAIVVLVLVVYPTTRWVMSRDGRAAAPSGGSSLQVSAQLYQAGRYDEAVASTKVFIAQNPNSADGYNNLAVSYLGLRKYDDAVHAAQEAIRLKPDFQLARNNLAWILQEKAKATSQPAPAPKPKPGPADATALVNQSLAHAQAKQFRECIDTATQATKLDPRSALAFNNIGFCAANLKLWDEALKNTEEALRLDPGLQIARNNLAWMQEEKRKAQASRGTR